MSTPRAAGGGARVAVVGGGPAGLAAAHRLQRSGASVTLFEARPWLGGRTRTDELEGYLIDAYTQFFGSMYREVFALLEAVGAGDLVEREAGRDALWRHGRTHEVVYGSVTSMLASGALPMGTKLRLGTRYLPFLTRQAPHLDMYALDRAADAGLDEESIAAWGGRELGRDFVEYLAYPLLAAHYGVTPEQTSAALYHMLAQQGMDVAVFSLRGGVGRLAERVAQAIIGAGGEVRTSEEVLNVEQLDGAVRIAGAGWAEDFDGSVVCVPGVEVPRLVDGLPDAARAWFGGVRYQPLASLALLLDGPAGARYFGLSFPRQESSMVATVCVQENKRAGLVPAGRGLLVVLPTPAAVPRLLEADPALALETVLPDLERAFPYLRSRVRRVKLYRWPVGGPVFYPGYLSHLKAFRQDVQTSERRVVFGGDYLVVPSTEGSVASGRRAADRLLEHLRLLA